MGNVAISITVALSGPDIDLENLKKEIRNVVEVKEMKEEEIGFGLKNLKILVIRPDAAGHGTDDIEKNLSELNGVASVTVDNVTLI